MHIRLISKVVLNELEKLAFQVSHLIPFLQLFPGFCSVLSTRMYLLVFLYLFAKIVNCFHA